MKKIMFLAIAGLGFFGLDANAGIFNKKSKTCFNGSCSSSQTSRVRTVVAAPSKAPSKAQAPTAPQKKVEAPSPVKAQESKPGQAPAPVKAPSKKVAAPQQ